jgi:seryl-tRNA synthetase
VDEKGVETPDSVIMDNLTEAMRFVRDLWPDAMLHGEADAITAMDERGKAVAVVRNFPERNPSPVERDIEHAVKRDEHIKALISENNRMTAELEAINKRNEATKREIERAKLEMLGKGTLIDELIRWTDTAKAERAKVTELEDELNAVLIDLDKWKAEARRES